MVLGTALHPHAFFDGLRVAPMVNRVAETMGLAVRDEHGMAHDLQPQAPDAQA